MGSNKKNADFSIKVASPNDATDAEVLQSLIQELADSLKMPNGPKLSADSLHHFLKEGAMHALIATATDANNETSIAGYAIYFVAPSTHFGKVFFLEDLYIRPNFRRQKLGSHFMAELKKRSTELACDLLRWDVLTENTNAIRFYTALGAKDLTTTTANDGEQSFTTWRIEPREYAAIILNPKGGLSDGKVTVFSLDNETKEAAKELMECWRSLDVSATSSNAEKKFMEMHCYFGLGIVQAQDIDGSVLGMALFHRCAFSTWTGPYITIDNLRVRADKRRQGIGTKLVAQLAKVAVDSDCPRIGWTLRANPETKAFLSSLGAINLTEKEGWLLFQME